MKDKTHITVELIRAPNDPTAASRVSIGTMLGVPAHYCVYRGPLDAAIAAVEASLKALLATKASGREPPITHT